MYMVLNCKMLVRLVRGCILGVGLLSSCIKMLFLVLIGCSISTHRLTGLIVDTLQNGFFAFSIPIGKHICIKLCRFKVLTYLLYTNQLSEA